MEHGSTLTSARREKMPPLFLSGEGSVSLISVQNGMDEFSRGSNQCWEEQSL